MCLPLREELLNRPLGRNNRPFMDFHPSLQLSEEEIIQRLLRAGVLDRNIPVNRPEDLRAQNQIQTQQPPDTRQRLLLLAQGGDDGIETARWFEGILAQARQEALRLVQTYGESDARLRLLDELVNDEEAAHLRESIRAEMAGLERLMRLNRVQIESLERIIRLANGNRDVDGEDDDELVLVLEDGEEGGVFIVVEDDEDDLDDLDDLDDEDDEDDEDGWSESLRSE